MSDSFKTFEELKEELGDKYDIIMYQTNKELLNKLELLKEMIKFTQRCEFEDKYTELFIKDLLNSYLKIIDRKEDV